MLVHIIDRKWWQASVWALISALFTAVGVIHVPVRQTDRPPPLPPPPACIVSLPPWRGARLIDPWSDVRSSASNECVVLNKCSSGLSLPSHNNLNLCAGGWLRRLRLDRGRPVHPCGRCPRAHAWVCVPVCVFVGLPVTVCFALSTDPEKYRSDSIMCSCTGRERLPVDVPLT